MSSCTGGCLLILGFVVLCWEMLFYAGGCRLILGDVVLYWGMFFFIPGEVVLSVKEHICYRILYKYCKSQLLLGCWWRGKAEVGLCSPAKIIHFIVVWSEAFFFIHKFSIN